MPRPNTIVDVLLRLVEDENGCLNWTGQTAGHGYGHVKWGDKTCKVHRVVWEYFRGPIPEDRQIHHLCRNTRCANPDHLAILTAAENTLESNNPAARNARKAECKRGHPLSGENLYLNPRGERQCRACQKARSQNYEERHHEQRQARHVGRYRRLSEEQHEVRRAKRRAAYKRDKEKSSADRSKVHH